MRDQHAGEPTLHDLSEALITVYGTDYSLRNAAWISRFHRYDPAGGVLSGETGSACRRRCPRAFPIGVQGLNNGVQDAVNLAWELA